MATMLQLAPEHGGTTFGPFHGMISIGSDPGQCQLMLPSNQGIYPLHATLAETGDTWVISPTSPECGVFVVPPGQQRAWPIQAAQQLAAGSQIIFGTLTGPRFTPQRGGAVGRAATAIGNSTGSRLASEVGRQGMARLLTQSPFRELYQASHRLRSGAFANPYYLVAAVLALGGALVGAGGLSCSGAGYAVYRALMY